MRKLHLLILILSASIVASAHSVQKEDGFFVVRHSWECDGRLHSIDLEISEELYDYYQNEREHLAYEYRIEDRETPVNFYSFILSDYDRPFIHELADRFAERAFTDYDKVNLAMTFVQSLPYAFDDESTGEDEYVRFPIETLVDGCGDCEDKVALLGAILYEMGIDFVLLSLPEHLALAVRCEGVMAERYISYRNKRYHYVETTMEGWAIGQVPPDYALAEVEVYPIAAEPTFLVREMCFESAAAPVYEKADCSLRLLLHNLGPGRVTGLQLHVWVYEGTPSHAKVIAEETFSLDDLWEGQNRHETLSFQSFIKEKAKLYIELSGDNIEPQQFDLPLNYSKTTRRQVHK